MRGWPELGVGSLASEEHPLCQDHLCLGALLFLPQDPGHRALAV